MKKRIGLVLAIGIIITMYFIIKPIRTFNVLVNIAKSEFQDVPICDSIRNQLHGPIIFENEKLVELKWYKVLDWGDTAAIYIDAFKFPTSFSWRNNFFWPRITMNYQWSYLTNPICEFDNILPTKYKKSLLLDTQLKLNPDHDKYFDNSELIIAPERLFFFLKEGYFRILKREDNFTVVEFYEPIGNVFIKNENKQNASFTLGAKVFVDKAYEIQIVPYKIPDELW